MQLKKISLTQLVLFSILIIGIFFRTHNLNNNPPRLTHDEMSIGYNAYSILKTGRDEWGKKLPLDFAAFGDHKLPGAIYTAVPFIYFFGLNSLSLRITSVVFGSAFILIAYGFGRELAQNKWVGLVMAGIVAVSPWPVNLSRMLLESNLALLFYGAGLLCLIKAIKKDQKKYLYLSGVFLAITLYYYVAYRLISSLTIVAAAAFYLKQDFSRIKQIIITLSIFGVIALPIFLQILDQGGEARFDQLSINIDQGIEAKLFEWRNNCVLSVSQLSPTLAQGCRFVGSPLLIRVKSFSLSYLKTILPTFSFIEGGESRYLSNQNFAEFFFFLSLFYLAGIYFWLQQKHQLKWLPLLMLILGPIPSALVGEPQIVRASAMIIPISFFTALGIVRVYQAIQLKKLRTAFAVSLLSLTIIYAGWFLFHDNYIYALLAEASYYPLPTEAVQKALEVQDDFDLIYIDEVFPDAHIAVAFYSKMDPQYYQDVVVRPEPDIYGFSHPTELGKYAFGNKDMGEFLKQPEKTLFITRNHIDHEPWLEFKDAGGVHTQAQLFDTGIID